MHCRNRASRISCLITAWRSWKCSYTCDQSGLQGQEDFPKCYLDGAARNCRMCCRIPLQSSLDRSVVVVVLREQSPLCVQFPRHSSARFTQSSISWDNNLVFRLLSPLKKEEGWYEAPSKGSDVSIWPSRENKSFRHPPTRKEKSHSTFSHTHCTKKGKSFT